MRVTFYLPNYINKFLFLFTLLILKQNLMQWTIKPRTYHRILGYTSPTSLLKILWNTRITVSLHQVKDGLTVKTGTVDVSPPNLWKKKKKFDGFCLRSSYQKLNLIFSGNDNIKGTGLRVSLWLCLQSVELMSVNEIFVLTLDFNDGYGFCLSCHHFLLSNGNFIVLYVS